MQYQSSILSSIPNILHGSISTKSFGPVSFAHGSKSEILYNRERVFEHVGIQGRRAVFAKQEHTSRIAKVGKQDMGKGVFDESSLLDTGNGVDAFITNEAGPVLFVSTADCLPMLFCDAKGGVVAIAHAGWKGTVKKIAQQVLQMYKNEYNIGSSQIYCAFGPSIFASNYDISRVNDDRLQQYEQVFGADSKVIVRNNGGTSLDLVEANKILLLEGGVKASHIDVSMINTYTSPAWASYRRDPNELASPIWSYIGLQR